MGAGNVLLLAAAASAFCASAQPVTMMSYSIRIGCGPDGVFNLPPGDLGHLPQVAGVIRSVNPDWVAIQEIDKGTKRTGFVDQTAELARLCGMHGTFVRKTLNTSGNEFRDANAAADEELDGCGEYGLAVLSKEEPIKVSKALVPGYYHTRCIEFVEFTNYVVACTHFPQTPELCLVAAEVALANISDFRKPVFLAGDLNVTPESETIAELMNEMTVLSDTTVPTFPSSGPTNCIDYIMVDTPHADRVTVTERRVISDSGATDHCAVVVKADVSEGPSQLAFEMSEYSFDWYVGDAVANFPAPMTLREGLNGFTYAWFAADGSDLRVMDSGGNLLPHEIEKWDTIGYSVVWVKLPLLSQSAKVKLSWCDPDADSADTLWPDAIQVLHFGDDVRKDSSPWNLSSSQTPDSVSGIVGGGMTSAKDAAKRFLRADVTPSELGLGDSTPFTIAFWMKGSASSENNYLYHMRTTSSPDAEVIVTYNYNEPKWGNVWPRTVELIGSGISRANSHIEAPDYGWHHFAYTYDGQNVRKYLDGALVGNVAATTTLKVWLDSYSSIAQRISVGGGTAGQNLSGASFDEFRLEKVARDAAWIRALSLTPAHVHDNDDVYEMSFPEYTGTETLTNFPLMVTLDDRLPGLPDGVRDAMRDVSRLHFYTTDGRTELPYEYELMPTERGTTATCWVRMPEFGPGTTLRVQTTPSQWSTNRSTVTKRYWASDAGAVNTNVWADGRFLHVYHLAVGRYRFDSVPFGGDLKEPWGTNWRATCPGIDGPTGRFGAMHSTTNTGMRALLGSGSPGVTNRYTLSFWARKDAGDFASPTNSYFCQIRHKDTGDTQWGVLTGFHGDGNKFKLWKNGGADGRRIDIPDADWHHYAFTCDGTMVRGYRDGAEVMTDDPLAFNTADLGNTYITVGGAAGAPNHECFRGDIDEFRMENEPRSADWIKACYQTQFARRGRVARIAAPAFGPDVRSAAAAGSITFASDLVCRVPSTLTLHYGATDVGTVASAWGGSVSLGTVDDGRVSGTVSGLSPDQGVFARFHAVNAYGEAWSAPISGRAAAEVSGLACHLLAVTNLAEGVVLSDFPLCVRIPSTLTPPATPETLRFTDNDGQPFAHEVESWDASGESIAWVRVPEMRRRTRVRMFWGSPFAATDVPASSVWNGDYEGVYHMASTNDSSDSALHFASDELPTNGVVGAGRQFTKASSRKGIMTASHVMEGLAGPFTISGWVNGSANMGETYLVMKKLSKMEFMVIFGYVPRTLQLCMAYAAQPDSSTLYSEMRQTQSLIDLGDEGWHHFAYAYDGASFGAYLDGVRVQSHAINMTQCGKVPDSQVGTLMLGRSPGGYNLFTGGLDELRLETTGRSAEWIKACYDDQRGGLTAMRYRPAGTTMLVR